MGSEMCIRDSVSAVALAVAHVPIHLAGEPWLDDRCCAQTQVDGVVAETWNVTHVRNLRSPKIARHARYGNVELDELVGNHVDDTLDEFDLASHDQRRR